MKTKKSTIFIVICIIAAICAISAIISCAAYYIVSNKLEEQEDYYQQAIIEYDDKVASLKEEAEAIEVATVEEPDVETSDDGETVYVSSIRTSNDLLAIKNFLLNLFSSYKYKNGSAKVSDYSISIKGDDISDIVETMTRFDDIIYKRLCVLSVETDGTYNYVLPIQVLTDGAIYVELVCFFSVNSKFNVTDCTIYKTI